MVLGARTTGTLPRERLHAVERAVAADADQAVDLELLEPVGDRRDRLVSSASTYVAQAPRIVPPGSGRARGSRKSGFRWTWGTSG